MFNVEKIRQDFPILARRINGHPLVYLDNAATSQKPRQVIEAMVDYYENHNANVHRAVHTLAEEATQLYEDARRKVAGFVGASPEEVVFTKNSTEAINLVAYAWGRKNLRSGDEILITEMEHHSNLVPWQLAAAETGATLRYVPFDKNGEIKISDIRCRLSKKTRFVSLVHVSNFFGTVAPIREVADLAHKVGAVVLVDGSQAVPHLSTNVKKLDSDFYVFTAHKMLGPLGVGVLYGRRDLLESMPPFLGGGDMIRTVTLEGSTWNDVPYKFEAGTPNVGGAVGLAAAVGYLEKIGMGEVEKYERGLTVYLMEKLDEVRGLKIYGPRRVEKKTSLVSFNLEDFHAHDVATLLDQEGIAVRSGHHCTMPAHTKLGIPASVRASFYLYNTKEEVDRLVAGLEKVRRILSK